MPSQRTVKFRPSIVLFVGSCGEQIHGHFIRLCMGLDEPLLAGVACIQVDEAGELAKRVSVIAHDGRYQDEPKRPLREVFNEALEEDGVQGERAHDRILDAGYAIENNNTQVIIAGHTGMRANNTRSLATIAQALRTFLVNEDVPTQIYYVLSDYRTHNQTTPINDTTAPAWASTLYGGGDLPPVTFCFIYQKKGQTQQTFNPRPTVEYASAEAVFGLVATGVVGVPALSEALQTSPRITDITERIGSLGTSLIRFPRAEAGDYCARRLAAELLNHWAQGLGRNISPVNRKQQQQDADRFERRLRGWIGGKLWAFRGDQEWPHLKRLSSDSQESLRRYEIASAKLFEPLRMREVERAAASRAGDDAWNEAVKVSAGRVGDFYPAWEGSARLAWAQAEKEAIARLDATVDALWLDDQGSWEVANEYVGYLSQRLVETKEQLIRWRQAHERRYRGRLASLLRMAPPATEDTSGSIIGTDDAEMMGLVRPDARGTPVSDDGLPPPVPSQHAPFSGDSALSEPTRPADNQQEREKDPLKDDLRRAQRGVERRIAYQRKRVPTAAALVGACLVADPPLALLALDVLPDAWRTSLVLASAIFLGIGFVLLLAGWLYRSRSLDRLEEAHLALIACYENMYRFKCDQHEDRLRAEVTMELHWHVQAMADLLRDWPRLILATQREFEADATATEAALFAGPGGARDVLIGNGEWLRTSLAPVYSVMRREQVGNPAVGWHATFEQINDHLRESFRASPRSVIASGKAAFKDSIVTFTRAIVEPYLARASSIGAALSLSAGASRDIWAAALQRSKPLYAGYGGGAEETIVCGRAAELRAVSDLPRGRRNTVLTKDVERNREWMLVAQFIQGGARTNWPPRFTPGRPVGRTADPHDTTAWHEDLVPAGGPSDGHAFHLSSPLPAGADSVPASLDATAQRVPDAGVGLPTDTRSHDNESRMPPGHGDDREDIRFPMPPGSSVEVGDFEAPPGPSTEHNSFEAPPGPSAGPSSFEAPPGRGVLSGTGAMSVAPKADRLSEWFAPTDPGDVSSRASVTSDITSWPDAPPLDALPPGTGNTYDAGPPPDDDDSGGDDSGGDDDDDAESISRFH